MKYYLEENLFLEYEFIENKNKPSLLFLNGLTQSFGIWKNCVIQLEQSYQILLIDLINQGNSGRTNREIDFDEHAETVNSLVKHLGLKDFWIAGISYGSLVAQHFAYRFPENLKGMVLISSFAQKNNYYKAIEVSWKNALEQLGYKFFLQTILPYVLGKTYFEGENFSAEKIISERMLQPIHENSLMLLMRATEKRKDFSDELKTIKQPVMIVHGEEDILFPVEMANYLARVIQNSELTLLPKTGHSINVEQPQLLAKKIHEFISKNNL